MEKKKKVLLNIPIEPIDKRYSKQWDLWFNKAFSATDDIAYSTIYGDATSGKIKNGSFLDVIETNSYKSSQLLKILQILSGYKDDYDLILFFHDIWFPGIEQLFYVRDGMGWKNLKITGCIHAGCYDDNDFLTKCGMRTWAKSFEDCLFAGVDKIFTATKYHRDLIMNNRAIGPDKICCSGFPMFVDTLYKPNKTAEKIVVFPHRLDPEKCPELFDKLSERFPNVRFVKTMEEADSKEAYYELLKKASVSISFAKQETWGIAMQESVFYGCLPLVPNKLSYKEMYNPIFKYNDFESLVVKLRTFLDNPPYNSLTEQAYAFIDAGRCAINRIINELKNIK